MTAAPDPREFLRFNADDARKLLDQLDHIHLVAILPDAPKGTSPQGRYFASDVGSALEWAAQANANGFNVYWTVNYVGPGVGTKPKKGDIQAARAAHCDLDPPNDGTPWDKAGKVAELAELELPPSLVIDSGNGVQPVWLLDHPAADWGPIERANMGLRDALGADDCFNIDRLLRVPGSINYPSQAKRKRGYVPCMATWAQGDTGKRYQPADLVAAFQPKAARQASAGEDIGDRVPTQTGALIAAIRRGDNWHNNMLRLTAHLVAKQRTTVEILAMADCLTLAGWTVEETRETMRGMIADARAKWDYREPDDARMGYVDADTGDWRPYSDEGIGLEALDPARRELQPLDLSALATAMPKPKRFIVPRLAPAGELSLFTGPGSAGKSLFGQQIATALAAGVPTLGFDMGKASAIYLTCEDDAETLHWRQAHLCQALNVGMASLAGSLHLVTLRGHLDNALGTINDNGMFVPSAAYGRLKRLIRETGAELVFLDNVAHLFTGNENDRAEVTCFINALNGLAGATGSAIILLGHTNKAFTQGHRQGNSNSGSTAWLNAVRSQFTIEHDEETDLRTLAVGKANYAKKGEEARFAWCDWAFVLEQELPEDAGRELADNIRANGENAAFLRCLEACTANRRNVSHQPGINYAPKIFAGMKAEAKGIKVEGFKAAMERLLHLGKIELDAELWVGRNRHAKRGIRLVA